MKKTSWKDQSQIKIARHMITYAPDVVAKIRNGHLKIHGIFEAIDAAQKAMLPVDLHKERASPEDVQRIKLQVKRLRAGITAAPVQTNTANLQTLQHLKNIDAELANLGLTAANRSKILNQVAASK